MRKTEYFTLFGAICCSFWVFFFVIFWCKILGLKNPACVKEMTNMRYALLSPSPLAFHLHLRQDIVDEAVLDEVEVDQFVLQFDDPPNGRVQQLSQQQPFDDGDDDDDDGDVGDDVDGDDDDDDDDDNDDGYDDDDDDDDDDPPNGRVQQLSQQQPFNDDDFEDG